MKYTIKTTRTLVTEDRVRIREGETVSFILNGDSWKGIVLSIMEHTLILSDAEVNGEKVPYDLAVRIDDIQDDSFQCLVHKFIY